MEKYIIIGIILVMVIWFIVTYNKFKRALVKIDESLSGIDVGLTKRYNILINMVEVVKGYTKYEQETLLKVINLRAKMSINEKADANNKMDEHVKRINILAESYPELKADEHFKTLQLSILDVEEHLQAARRFYNSNISMYNQMITSFPSNLVAKIFKLEPKEFFAAKEEEKENVVVNLSK